MNIEQANQRSIRAAKHAALADPARLLMVDQLTLGDASPSELQERLGMTSNLLSHHVRVLEANGIVVRRRSQGDRRRTYLRLMPSSLDGLLPGRASRSERRVVFVCTANSARSQLAAALWRRASLVPTASAGTRPASRIEPAAVSVAERRGLTLRGKRPQRVSDVVAADDLVITVCDSAHEELGRSDATHWSVPDPVSVGTDAAFDLAVDELSARVDGLAPWITTSHPSTTRSRP